MEVLMSPPVAWILAGLFLVLFVMALWWLVRKIRTLIFRLLTTTFVLGCLVVGLWTTYLLLRG
jgi:hypothetical protein